MSKIIRVFGALACLGFLAGCAAGVQLHNPEDGWRLEGGFYPTDSVRDLDVGRADADTRAIYAVACDKARQPAACLEAMSLGVASDRARRAYYSRGRHLRYYASACGSHNPFAVSARPDSGAGAADTETEIARRQAEVRSYASWTASLVAGPDTGGSMGSAEATLVSHVAPPPSDSWGLFVDPRAQEERVAAMMSAPRPLFGSTLEQLLAGPRVKCAEAPRYKDAVRQAVLSLVRAWRIKCEPSDTTCLPRQEHLIRTAFTEMELAVKDGYDVCKADNRAAELFNNLQKVVEELRKPLRPFLTKGGVS